MNKPCSDCGILMTHVRKDKCRCAGCSRKRRTKQALERNRSLGVVPRGIAATDVVCLCCGTSFATERRTRRWCDSCRSLGKRGRDEYAVSRQCQWCGESRTFTRGDRARSNKRYCSPECKRQAALESRMQSRERQRLGETSRAGGRPRKHSPAEATAYRNGSLQERFFIRNPDIAKQCQSCGEGRVVELAHKIPRRSAWRKLPASDEVWVLCPTCHKLLDYGIESRESLGIPE